MKIEIRKSRINLNLGSAVPIKLLPVGQAFILKGAETVTVYMRADLADHDNAVSLTEAKAVHFRDDIKAVPVELSCQIIGPHMLGFEPQDYE